jgi:hypothetical protein
VGWCLIRRGGRRCCGGHRGVRSVTMMPDSSTVTNVYGVSFLSVLALPYLKGYLARSSSRAAAQWSDAIDAGPVQLEARGT